MSTHQVAEAACVAAGFGFEGYGADGASLGYAGVSNVDIVNFELATSAQRISRTWNMRTQVGGDVCCLAFWPHMY